MHRSGLLLQARLLFLFLFVLSVPVLGLVLLYTDKFEAWRRARAEASLGDAVGLDTTISGPITIGFGLEHPVAGVAVDVLAFPFNLLESIVQPEPAEAGRIPCRVTVATSR